MAVPAPDAGETVAEASSLFMRGRGQEAMALLHGVLRADPSHAMALAKLAEIEVERKDIAAALPRLHRVLDAQPNFAPALATLAQAAWIGGDPLAGLAHARRAVEIQPPNPQFRLILGQLCVWLGRFDEARALGEALLDPALFDAHTRTRALGLLGELDIAQGEYRAACVPLRAALALTPDHAQTHMMLGMNLLRLGDLEAGWAHYAWRDKVSFFHPDGMPALPGKRWRGERLFGRRLLLKDDQGFGDAIQFFRYLQLLKDSGAGDIVLVTYEPLARLFGFTPLARVVTAVPPGLVVDLHCLTSDLPFLMGTRLGSIPADVPYLGLGLALLPKGGRRKSARRRVGLVWSGDPRHLRDHHRSIPAEIFLRISDGVACAFQSLQRVVRDRDAAALESRAGIARLDERTADFAGTAMVIAGLDLVITVDTSVAHLAGAMGKPVWILLPVAPDWRWLTGRDDSPWYPTARLFHAGIDGWEPVIVRVKQALRDWVAR